MIKATMYREPLELYLFHKIKGELPGLIKKVRIRHLREPRGGCNWDIEIIEPSLPVETAAEINRRVVAPLRNSIDLAE
jgi:hypothetical protein